MIRSSVTISLAQGTEGGPFLFWGDIEECCRQAAEIGFDAIEIHTGEYANATSADAEAALRKIKNAATAGRKAYLLFRHTRNVLLNSRHGIVPCPTG